MRCRYVLGMQVDGANGTGTGWLRRQVAGMVGLFSLFGLTSASEALEVDWAIRAGGEGADNDLSYAIGAAEDGTVVISGAFRNSTKMGGVGLKSRKGNDIFVARLKAN